MKTNGNKLLLDTSAIIEILSGNKSVADKIHKYSDLYINAVALGELYIGVYRVLNKPKQLKQIQEFIELCNVLVIDKETANHYGEIQAELYKKGKPLPVNDIWIAATAKQYNLPIATKDKHFLSFENTIVKIV